MGCAIDSNVGEVMFHFAVIKKRYSTWKINSKQNSIFLYRTAIYYTTGNHKDYLTLEIFMVKDQIIYIECIISLQEI